MRKKRDAEGTKERVLESAERLFADRGFNGTSLAEVSRASGISDGLILYHFGSKEKLYHEVLERSSTRYARLLSSRRETNLPPVEMLKDALRAVFDFWKTDETYHRISLWAYLERREDSSAQEAHLTAGLASYLRSLQEAGFLSPGIHPVVFLSMIIGPIHFWFRYKKRFAEILGLPETCDELDDLFQSQHGQMLSSFLHEPE